MSSGEQYIGIPVCSLPNNLIRVRHAAACLDSICQELICPNAYSSQTTTSPCAGSFARSSISSRVLRFVPLPATESKSPASSKAACPPPRSYCFTMYDDAIRSLAPVMGANALLTKSEGISALLRTIRSMLSDKMKRIEETLAHAVHKREADPIHLESLTRRFRVPLNSRSGCTHSQG